MNGRRIGFGLFTLAMVAFLVGLGVWQLQRRVEKHALIAALNERLAASPVAAAGGRRMGRADAPQKTNSAASPSRRPMRRCRMRWSIARARRCARMSPGPAPGRFLPARLADGEIVAVNAGFVQNTMQDRAQQDRAVEAARHGRAGQADRLPALSGKRRRADADRECRQAAVVRARPAGDGARARLGRGRRAVAPFYIDLEAPVPDSGIPKPGPLHVHLKDDHLQYAITWFTLAGAVRDRVRHLVAGAAAGDESAGWVERSETHHFNRKKTMGFAALYASCAVPS